MRSILSGWDVDLTRWLKPFLDRLGQDAAADVPAYVAGLIGPGDRKSVQPMAERLAPGDYDQLPWSIGCARKARHGANASSATSPR